ncbi:hypothetical protein NW759_015990 [Fusarium solani]|nr:hypothetical protein NW759_015990 [Fusarium solani]
MVVGPVASAEKNVMRSGLYVTPVRLSTSPVTTRKTNRNGWMAAQDKKKWQRGCERTSKSKPIAAVQSENACCIRLYHKYHLETLAMHNRIPSHKKKPNYVLR